jgi:EmrB/QacA subfamily drug resistance transporter
MTLQTTTQGASRPFVDRYATLDPRAIKGVLASLALVMLTASLDSTAVGTALPRIVSDLRGNDLYAWVFTAYLLSMVATMPLWGSLSDRLGRRPVLFTGLVIFLIGSALCGVSQEMWQLVLFRGIQGVGAGAIAPVSLAVIGDLYPPADRARLQAAFSSLFVLAFLIGPTVGGLLTDTLGWRWVFYLNLPIGLIALAVMWRFMPQLRPEGEVKPFDVAGMIIFVLAVVPFLIGIRNLPTGEVTDPDVGGLMLTGLLVGLAFLWVETRASMPIIPVSLFRDATFAVACAVVFLSVAGLFVAIVFLPRYFQLVHGASATESGWQIMTLLLGLIVGAVGAGQVVARTGRWKMLLLVAMAIGMVGMALLSQLTAHAPMPLVWGAMFLTGLGLGPITSVLTAVVQTTVPPDVMGTATSTVSFFRQLGASIWLAVGGSLFSAAFRAELPVQLRADGVPADLVAGLTGGSGAVASEESATVGDLGASILAALPPEARAVVEPFIDAIVGGMHEAFSLATGDAFLLGIGAVAIAFLVLLPLREQRLPLERLAELRERRAVGSQSSPSAEAPGLSGTASGN